MIGLLVFYGSLTALAVWATWRDENLRWIGVALLTSWAASNFTWFLLSVVSRPAIYTMTEMFVMVSAYMAWEMRRPGPKSDQLLLALIAVSTLSTMANVALARVGKPTFAQIHLHELATNICFALECLIVAGVGVADGYRTGRFARWGSARRSAAQPDAASRGGGPWT